MGQRTAILLKKNFGHNKSTISLIHHQWGIGKTMPAYLMQEILKATYPLDRSLEYSYGEDSKLPIEYFYTFKPLSNEQNNYITDKEVKTNDPNEDIWNRDVRINYGNQTDNNNGLMLVEVTQLYEDKEETRPRTYSHCLDVKVGFALGNEETCYCHKNLKDYIILENDFDRLVSAEEFAVRTFGGSPKAIKYTKKFIRAFKTVMELQGVKEIYDKEGAKTRKKLEEHINNCIEALTMNLKDHETIDVPEKFKNKRLLYV